MSKEVFKHIILCITQVNKLNERYGPEQEARIKRQVPDILAKADIKLNYERIFVYTHG